MAKKGGTPENLRSRSSDEARMNGKKGGIESGRSRRQHRAWKDLASAILSMPMERSSKGTPVRQAEHILSLAESENINMTLEQAILLAQARNALEGDTKAAEFLLKVLDEGKGIDLTDKEISIVIKPLEHRGKDAD